MMAAQMMAAQMAETPADQTQSGAKVLTIGVRVDPGQCTRCGGLMVADRYIDLLDDTGQLEFTADRCIQCGEVVDQIILRNRIASQARTARTSLAQVA
jgi:ferredoxin